MLALIAPESSHFRSVSFLRTKESDRLAFIEQVSAAAGGGTESSEHDLVVHPALYYRKGVKIETRNDHRRALAGSLLVALGWKEIGIDEASCVNKSFPLYWETIAACGAILEAR
jgi:3-phosphoshikimate 1-carboxyvinyltransferase